MKFLSRLSAPSLPPSPTHDIPPAARHTARTIGRVGWLAFWGYLIAGAIIVALLVLAIISRSLDDSDRTFWVGLSIVAAIASFITILASMWLAFRLTRCAQKLMLPYMQPTPDPIDVQKQLLFTLFISLVGLGIGLLGTEISAISLLAKTLAHPQGAALYSPESTLRVLDVMVILINGGLAITHFSGLSIYGWALQQVQSRLIE